MENPPGFRGEDTLRKIAAKSNELSGCDRLCVHLSDRLGGLYPIVSSLDGDRWLSIWSDYCNTACGFLQLLRVQLSRKELLFRLATSHNVVCQVRLAHDRLDSIYEAIGVAEDETLATVWRENWDEDRVHQACFFAEAVDDTTIRDLITDFKSPFKLEETLMELHKQIQTHQGAESSISRELLELMSQVWGDANRIQVECLPEELYEWFVLADEVEVESPPIGEGMFSKFYRGKWTNPGREGIVAVKRLSKTDDRDAFSSEISVWWGLQHHNILRMLGANHIVKRKFFVSEFANAGNFSHFFNEGGNREMLWNLFTQVATGLAYLHEHYVEYGGLKCSNLLLHREESGELVAKLSDFGLSRIRMQSVPVSIKERLNDVRWKAPERLLPSGDGGINFFRSDIYSLGLCIIEAVMSEPPFGMDSVDEVIDAKLSAEPVHRPDEAFSDREWDLVSRMIDFQPENRPDVHEVITTMSELNTLQLMDTPGDGFQQQPLPAFIGDGKTESTARREGSTLSSIHQTERDVKSDVGIPDLMNKSADDEREQADGDLKNVIVDAVSKESTATPAAQRLLKGEVHERTVTEQENVSATTLEEAESEKKASFTQAFESTGVNDAATVDRWDFTVANGAVHTVDRLGDHTASRYRAFRRFIEELDDDGLDRTLFGLLLSVESLRDELRSYEEQTSALVRLAQTGHVVRQLRRLNNVLDDDQALSASWEPPGVKNWEEMLEEERAVRMENYGELLATLRRAVHGEIRASDQCDQISDESILAEIKSEEQQEEVLTLLKYAIDKNEVDMNAIEKYEDVEDEEDASKNDKIEDGKVESDLLTPLEFQNTKEAFRLIAKYSGIEIPTLPTWFAPWFEFSSSFGLSRWGNDVFIPEYSDKTRFIREVSVWSCLNHPHIAKFLGACHVGSRMMIVHENLRPLREHLEEVKDRRIVWRRMYEVALCLQYLFARGLSCERLDMENVYCLDFEDKAVLRGVGLVADEQSRDVSQQDDEDRELLERSNSDGIESVHAQSVASNVVALGVMTLNALHQVATSPPSASTSSGPSNTMRMLSKDTHSAFHVIPLKRPGFITEDEWKVLCLLSRLETASTGALLEIVHGMGRMAESVGKHDQLATNHELKFPIDETTGLIDVGQIRITAAYRAAAVMSICERRSKKDSIVKPVYKRVKDIYDRLQDPQVQHSCCSSLHDMIQGFVAILRQFNWFLNNKKARSDSFPQKWCLDSSEKDPAAIFTLHLELDRFLDRHDFDCTSDVHRWRPEWEVLCAKLESRSLNTLLRAASLGSNRTHDIAIIPNESPTNQTETDTTDELSLSNWFVSPSEIEVQLSSELGRGSFGAVYSGKWLDAPVAVKQLFIKREKRKQIRAQFRHEADIWFRLNHINVVKMYGACDVGEPLFFVCEHATGGTLTEYLRLKDRPKHLIWYSLLNAALGLQYLHDNDVVHGDLKGNNILVGADDVVKLMDFGLSTSRRQVQDKASGGALGAYRWKAPECLAGERATFASDVYSFAMVMIEIVTDEYPWGNRLPDVEVQHRVKRGELPFHSPEFSEIEWNLIKRMCCPDPSKRVTIGAVVTHLSSMLEEMDFSDLVSSVFDNAFEKPFQNRIMSREGALLNLLSLIKSGANGNRRLSGYASSHLLSVHLNRGRKSSQREIEAIVDVLISGKDAEKMWAMEALGTLSYHSEGNQVSIAAAGAIHPLVTLVRDGTDKQKENAALALTSLSLNNDNKIAVAAAGAIDPLVTLVRDGTDKQKENAASASSDLSVNEENEKVVATASAKELLETHARDDFSTYVDFKALICVADAINSLTRFVLDDTEDKRGDKYHELSSFDLVAVAKDVIEKIVLRSSELGGNSIVCERVASRLVVLLWVMISKASETLAVVESKFLDTVDKILQLIRVHQNYNCLLYSLANSQRLVRQITQAHTRIDEMYVSLGEVEDPELAAWREIMTEDLKMQARRFNEDLSDTDESTLVREINNSSKIKEILMMLKIELDAFSVKDPDVDATEMSSVMGALMRETFERIERFTDVHIGDAFSWFVPTEDIKWSRSAAERITPGTLGQLFKGTWTDGWNDKVVAIKQLPAGMDNLYDNNSFAMEVDRWSKLKHENILEMLGANHLAHRKFFITEYATEGNFVDFFVHGDEGNQKWLWDFFKQAATGLQFLHTKKIEHGGLKTNNLLVTRVASGEHERLVVKVSDFGMSVVRNVSVTVSDYACRDMGRWSALECLEHRSNGANGYVKSDIYSLGLCLVHAASGEKPYASFDIVTSTTKLENPIRRPDGAFTDAEWSLVARMIDNDPNKRPSLDEVIATMHELDSIRQRESLFDKKSTEAKSFFSHNLLDLQSETTSTVTVTAPTNSTGDGGDLPHQPAHLSSSSRLSESDLRSHREEVMSPLLRLSGSRGELTSRSSETASQADVSFTREHWFSSLRDRVDHLVSTLDINAGEGVANTLETAKSLKERVNSCILDANEIANRSGFRRREFFLRHIAPTCSFVPHRSEASAETMSPAISEIVVSDDSSERGSHHQDAIELAKTSQWDELKRLVAENPAMAEQMDSNGMLALHWACTDAQGATEDVMRALLVAFPHSVRVASVDGLLPLHFALRAKAGVELLRMLLEMYPDAALCKTRTGELALDLARKNELPESTIAVLEQACFRNMNELLVPWEIVQAPVIVTWFLEVRKELEALEASKKDAKHSFETDWRDECIEFLHLLKERAQETTRLSQDQLMALAVEARHVRVMYISKLPAFEQELMTQLFAAHLPESSEVREESKPWFVSRMEFQTENQNSRVVSWNGARLRLITSLESSDESQRRCREHADKWADVEHPLISRMYGANDVGVPFVACEFVDGNSLSSYISTARPSATALWLKLYSAAVGICWLHERGLVCGNITLNHIVVSSTEQVKLDFHSSWTDGGDRSREDGVESPHLAPEIYSGREATTASDIFAFGMAIKEVANSGFAGDVEGDLVKAMTSDDPDDRPTMATVVSAMYNRIIGAERCLTSVIPATLPEPVRSALCTLASMKGPERNLFLPVIARVKLATEIGEYSTVATTAETASALIEKYAAFPRLILMTLAHQVTHQVKILHEQLDDLECTKIDIEDILPLSPQPPRLWEMPLEASCAHFVEHWTSKRLRDEIMESASKPQADQLFVEVLTLLQYELTTYQAVMSKEVRSLLHFAYTQVAESAGMCVLNVPSWFIPSYGIGRTGRAGTDCAGGFSPDAESDTVVGEAQSELQLRGESSSRSDPGRDEMLQWLEWEGSRVLVKRVTAVPARFSSSSLAESSTESLGWDLESWVVHQANLWSRLHHRHLAGFIGACHVGSDRMLIFEDASSTMEEHIQTSTDRDDVWRLLQEAAMGLSYLHEQGIVMDGINLNNTVVCKEVRDEYEAAWREGEVDGDKSPLEFVAKVVSASLIELDTACSLDGDSELSQDGSSVEEDENHELEEDRDVDSLKEFIREAIKQFAAADSKAAIDREDDFVRDVETLKLSIDARTDAAAISDVLGRFASDRASRQQKQSSDLLKAPIPRKDWSIPVASDGAEPPDGVQNNFQRLRRSSCNVLFNQLLDRLDKLQTCQIAECQSDSFAEIVSGIHATFESGQPRIDAIVDCFVFHQRLDEWMHAIGKSTSSSTHNWEAVLDDLEAADY